MLNLILGVAGSGKTSYITQKIKSAVQSEIKGVFLIVPEQYSHEAERELCAICGDSLSLYAEVLSFSRLAVRVAQETGTGGKIFLDNGGKLLCMSLSLSQIGTQLQIYSSACRKAETQLSMLKTIDELKSAGISSQDLKNTIQSANGELVHKLYDISFCMEAYEAVLSNGRADQNDKLFHLAETIGKSSVGNNGQIYIDGFTDFTKAERLVIFELLKKGADITICLTCDDIYTNYEHFEPSAKAAQNLLSMSKEANQELKIIKLDKDNIKNSTLSLFAEHLYSYTSEQYNDTENCLSIYRTNSVREECELAASRCIELVRDKKCRWRDIAIDVRGYGSYSATLDEIFRLYDVPLFYARRDSILQKSIPNLILSAFEVIQGGFAPDDILTYIKTGLTGISLEDCDLLESYIKMWSPKANAWISKNPWTQHPKGYGAEFDEASRKQLSRINNLKTIIATPLLTLLEVGKKETTAKGQAHAFSNFLLELNLPEILENRANVLNQSGWEQLASEYVQLWDIVVSSIEQFAAILGNTAMSQEEFSKLFLQELSQYDVSSIPVSADSVTAGEMDRMRRRNIKHLIILGVSDDRLPQISQSDNLLGLEERIELSEVGIELSGSDTLPRELLLIYNCITLPSETLCMSYCAFDSNGGQTRPAFPIVTAKKLFNKEPMEFNAEKAKLCAIAPSFYLAANAMHGGSEYANLAYEYFASTDKGSKKLKDLRVRAEAHRGALSRSSVQGLYGKIPKLSPSKADAFTQCRFFYFLRYGLKLNEKEKAGFEAPELGTFTHFVLEKTIQEISATTGFKNADIKLAHTLSDKYTDEYIHEQLNDFADKSQRFIYLFNRLRSNVRKVVTDTVMELQKSDFAPLNFELKFMNKGDLPPVKIEDGKNCVIINGIADRVDGFLYKDKLYLRIVDYKTGKKSFSLSDVKNGLGMQMLIYLFALESEGNSLYGKDIVPTGVMYVPAHNKLISASGNLSDDELKVERQKAVRRSGLLLDDPNILNAMEHSDTPIYLPIKYKKDGSISSHSLVTIEQLDMLHKFVDSKMLELADTLKSGNIDAEPLYKSETDNACMFCPYESICRFDDRHDLRRCPESIKPAEFWKILADGDASSENE